MSRTLEVIFQRLFSLVTLLVLLPLVGVGVAYMLPRSYQVTASLWALRRYVIIGASGPETDILSTPAETQATSLSELLQSRTFALAVANATSLPSTLSPDVQANPENRDDTLVTDIAKVQVAAQGYNLFVINYQNSDAEVAQQVVASVIKNFGLQSQSFTVVEGEQLLSSYQTQLVKARQDANTAVNAAEKYIATHPELKKADLLTDPEYGLLQAQAQQAQATLQNIQNEIASINQEISTQGNAADNLFKVLDSPTVPKKPTSRLKVFLYGGGVGAGLALLACVLYMVITLRRDRTVYAAQDLQKVTSFPVLMQLPHLATVAVPLLLEAATSRKEPPGSSENVDLFYLES